MTTARPYSVARTSRAWRRRSAGSRGKFLLSINDNAGVRACFAAFEQLKVDTTYHIGARPKTAGELIISNFPVAIAV
jgi:hypothetical protein